MAKVRSETRLALPEGLAYVWKVFEIGVVSPLNLVSACWSPRPRGARCSLQATRRLTTIRDKPHACDVTLISIATTAETSNVFAFAPHVHDRVMPHPQRG